MKTDDMTPMKDQSEAGAESSDTLSLVFFESMLCRDGGSCGAASDAATNSDSDDNHSVGSSRGQADEGNGFEKHPAALTPRDDTSDAFPISKSATNIALGQADVTDGNRMNTKKKRKMLRQLKRKRTEKKMQHRDAAQSRKPMTVDTMKCSRLDGAPSSATR